MTKNLSSPFHFPMLTFLAGFAIFNLLYQVLGTNLIYGRGLISPEMFALLRDILWVLFVACIFFLSYRQRKPYFQKWKRSWILLIGLLFFGFLISYFIQDKSLSDILIGVKYSFFYLIILLSATMAGFFFKDKFTNPKIQKFGKIFLIIVVVGGFLRQIAKLLFPDFFFDFGYGKLDDFHYGVNPPIYYLTGFEGTLRWQGFFSGPNNYGYFLVAFLPLVMLRFRPKFNSRKAFLKLSLSQKFSLFFVFLRILALVMTLSRTAFIGGIVVLFLLNIQFFLKHKKLLIWTLLSGVVLVGALSILKRESSMKHIVAKFSGLEYVIQQPLGYGFGSSGPAIHHGGTMLPENYFIQVMLEVGTVGFLIWILLMFQILGIQKTIQKNKNMTESDLSLLLQEKKLVLGFFTLLIMGIMLHVFEDSMVNYLFFIPYGIALGALSLSPHGNFPFFFPGKQFLTLKK